MIETFAIESNGLLEQTACYINGKQLGGLKELYINIDEAGIFDAIIQYEAEDKQIYTCRLFNVDKCNIKTVQPSFTEEEASQLILFEIESDGTLDNTTFYFNNDELSEVVSLFIHIKAVTGDLGIKHLFKEPIISDKPIFKTEIVFRNDDDTLSTETIF